MGHKLVAKSKETSLTFMICMALAGNTYVLPQRTGHINHFKSKHIVFNEDFLPKFLNHYENVKQFLNRRGYVICGEFNKIFGLHVF